MPSDLADGAAKNTGDRVPCLRDLLLDGPFELSARPEPLPGDLRLAWGMALVILILGRSRGKRASLQKLHFMAHSARTRATREQTIHLFAGGLSKSLGLGDSLDIGNLFGTKKTELAVQPGSEPTREALTQPPAGYQTPSPNYPYAPESKGLLGGESNPDRNPLAQRSSATSMAK